MVKAKLRLALAVISAVLFILFLIRMSFYSSKYNYDEYGFAGHGLQLRKLNQPFSWHEDQEGSQEENKTSVTTCRNSVQGKALIADDKGYVCRRDDLQGNGCCHPNVTHTIQYACSECNADTGCCKLYEHCISCCMDPTKKPVLMKVLNEAKSLKNILLLSVSDHFELCLAKCRTSSSSLQHENSYINPVNKHCFTKERPARPNVKEDT